MQIKNYISECDHCQRMKSFPEKPAGKLKPNEATSQHWKNITTDFITGLPEAQVYNALFVTCCHHTKEAHIIPTSTTTSARGLAHSSEIMSGNYMVCQKLLYQIEDHNLQQSL